MRGKIKAIFEKEKTYGITFNGSDWYVGFLSDKPDWLVKGESEGTEVEFEYSKHKSGDREYNNIVKGTLKKVEAEKPVEEQKEKDTQDTSNDATLLKDRISVLNKHVLDLSKQLMFERSKKDELSRREIRKSVCLKAGIDLVSRSALVADTASIEEKKVDILKLVLYFAKEFENYFENE